LLALFRFFFLDFFSESASAHYSAVKYLTSKKLESRQISWYQDCIERDYGVLEWQWHQSDNMPTICTILQTDNHTNTLSLNFRRQHALPDAQPIVSNHFCNTKKLKI